MKGVSRLVTILPLLLLPACAGGGSRSSLPGVAAADSAEVAAVVERYHAALAAADTAAAMALLAPDAVVLESGGLETRAEYREHHLPADMEFAREVSHERASIAVRVEGPVAWAHSTSTSRGRFRDREVNSRGVELMVLRRTSRGWQIEAIHWSSRNLSP